MRISDWSSDVCSSDLRASASSDSRHWRHEVTKIKSERVILAARPNGAPRPNNFGIAAVELPEIEDGEVLLATRYLSLAPYERGRMDDRNSIGRASCRKCG